jgi:hypothetical protein
MVARLTLAALICLTAVSCSSIFDSYFPESLEYLDSQVSLLDALGGKQVVSIQLRYLPAVATGGSDVLAILAGTSDGSSHVLFYNPSNLALRKSYSDSDFRNQNGGTIPNLGLIAQDPLGIYTGTLSYDPVSLNFETTPGTLGDFFTSANYQGARETWDGTNAIVFSSSNGVGYYSSTSFVTLAASSLATTGVTGSGGGFAVLDAAAVAGTYYVVANSGQTALLATGTSAASVAVTATESMGQSNQNGGGGWVTSGAAVVQNNNNNNNTTLTAYSWSGSSLGSLHLYTVSNQIIALAFDPRGGSWYLFDSSTGKLSRNRTWW